MRSSVHGIPASLLALLCALVFEAAGEACPFRADHDSIALSPAPGDPSGPPLSCTEPSSDNTGAAKPVDRNLRLKNAAVIGGTAAVVAAYGSAYWWNEGMTSSPKIHNEGWFGQDTYAGGADKLGHAFSTYTGTRLLSRGFQALGNDPAHSLRLAGWTSFGILAGIELVDSFSEKWRFSYEDVVFNAAGVAFAVLMEKFPRLDDLLDFRLFYRRSDDARRLGEHNALVDYSGQIYLLAFKADGVSRLRDVPLVRYMELQIGYGTHGYEPNDGVKNDPHRRIYYGVGINLSRLLSDTVFRGDLKGGTIQRGTDTLLEFLQIPGTDFLTYNRL